MERVGFSSGGGHLENNANNRVACFLLPIKNKYVFQFIIGCTSTKTQLGERESQEREINNSNFFRFILYPHDKIEQKMRLIITIGPNETRAEHLI